MIPKSGRREIHKCLVINILVNTAVNWCPQMTMFALFVENLILLVHRGVQNAEIQLKQVK
jgi:hypothetical protein